MSVNIVPQVIPVTGIDIVFGNMPPRVDVDAGDE